jgi:hypothetical protein
MSQTVDDLILDLLEWIGPGHRGYLDVLDVWRTSCPRLPVWEEAVAQGFIERDYAPELGQLISVSAVGKQHLQLHRNSAINASRA